MYWRRHCLSFHRVLKRLLTRARREIFLIVDRGPAFIARKTQGVCESLNGSLRLLYLPPIRSIATPTLATPLSFASRSLWLAPPDALGRKHRKAGTVGRRAIAGACGAARANSTLDSRLGNLP